MAAALPKDFNVPVQISAGSSATRQRLQGADLDPFSVPDLMAQQIIVPVLRAIVLLENVADVKYQINLAGTWPRTLISYSMPRTLCVGVEAFRN